MTNPSLISRRRLLSSACLIPLVYGQALDSTLSLRVFDAVWTGVRDEFYDPKTRGVDWSKVYVEVRPRVQACTSRQQLLLVLRQMLSRLHNSHISLYSREEWDLHQNILPFCFDVLGSRVFVRYELTSKDPQIGKQFQFGDEILSVDGVEANKLRPLTLARLEEIYGNPNFGPAGSVAKVHVRRRGSTTIIKAQRVTRPTGFETAVLEHRSAAVAHLRLFTLQSSDLPAERLQHLWEEVCRSRGLILDFRNCVGGDSEVNNFLAGSLLGGGKPLFREIPRPEALTRSLQIQSL